MLSRKSVGARFFAAEATMDGWLKAVCAMHQTKGNIRFCFFMYIHTYSNYTFKYIVICIRIQVRCLDGGWWSTTPAAMVTANSRSIAAGMEYVDPCLLSPQG